MSHSSDDQPPRYKASDIQILSTEEVVRKRPEMFFGSTDSRDLHRLLQLAVEGLLWHCSYLGQTSSQITVHLEADGSATVLATSRVELPNGVQQSLSLLREEVSAMWVKQMRPFLHLRGSNGMSELCVVNALSAPLNVRIRKEPHRWHSLQFERGVFLREEELSTPIEEYDILFRFWPDFTILDPAAFDEEQVQQAMHSISKDFPAVPLVVVDTRL